MRRREMLRRKDWRLSNLPRYFIHGVLFSGILLGLSFALYYVIAVLTSIGFVVGFVIGIVLLLLAMAYLNTLLMSFIWSAEIKRGWRALLSHGLVLFVMELIVGLPALLLYYGAPSLATAVLAFVVNGVVGGFAAKKVANIWVREPGKVIPLTEVISSKRLAVGTVKTFLAVIVELAIIFPVIWVFSASIRSYSSLLTTTLQIIPPNPTLEAYSWVFFESSFWTWLRNSLFVCFFTTGLVILIASPAAYVMSRFRFLGKRPILYGLIFIQFVPGLLMFIAFFYLLLTLGLYDNLFGLALIYTALLLPFNIWNLKAFFDTIPKDIDEAALIDGASYLDAMFNVVFPVSLPGLAVTAFFSFLSGWNEFIIASLVLASEENYTLPLGLYGLSQVTFQINWPRFAALSVLGSIPLIVLFIFAQRYLRAGLAIGAVKG